MPTPSPQGLAQLLKSELVNIELVVEPKPQLQTVGKIRQLQSVPVPNRPPQPVSEVLVQPTAEAV